MSALVATDGTRIPMPVTRWRRDVDADEVALLAALPAPVLDVGCGPGRVALHLAAAGVPALGIDPAPTAIAEATDRGAAVLARSVFDPLPAEGRWGAAVLLDGNIGIGGDPARLLARLRQLLRAGGTVVAELGPPGCRTERLAVRVEHGGGTGPWFPWALVGADAWRALAEDAGFETADVAPVGGRWFGEAVR